jgi:hypothetical protein
MTNKVTSRHVHDNGRQETVEGRHHGFPISEMTKLGKMMSWEIACHHKKIQITVNG